MKKNLLKIVSALAAAAMMLTSTALAKDNTPEYTFNKKFAQGYKVNEMPTFSDEKDLTQESELLIRMNIISGYDDGTLKLDRTITRAEASRMLCYAINSADMIEGFERTYTKEGIEEMKRDFARAGIDFEYNGFSDVDIMSWYHPYVYAAKNFMNCIGGYEDGTFRPENTVSEIEFLTMLERALGYSGMIEAEGGYPDGVISIANRLKLIDNPSDAPAARERAVTMIYNALNSHIVTADGLTFNENGTLESTYSLTYTLLEYRDICKVHGTIKKSSVLPDKTLVFVPDNDLDIDRFRLYKGKEYTFVKEYSDITEGEHDVYIDYYTKGNEVIIAAF